MTIKNNTLVYRHRRLDNNKIFYIGIGTIKNRPFEIRNRNKIWKDIVNKTDYSVEILAENLTWEDACELECFLIQQYGRIDLKTGSLSNLTDGGDGISGNIRSEETRIKISKGHIGKILSEETKRKIREINTGKKLSEITKNKIKLANTGGKNNNARKVIDIITLKVFDSIAEAADYYNINRGYLYTQLENN